MPRTPRTIGLARLVGFTLLEHPDPAALLHPHAPSAFRADNLLQQLAFYYACNISLDTPVYQMGFQIDVDGHRYSYEAVGTKAEPTSPPEAPCVLLDHVPQAPFPFLLAWRRRVYAEGRRFYVEVCWHPETGASNRMVWPAAMSLTAADAHRRAALIALHEVERRGRPPMATRYYSYEAFHVAYPRARADAQRRRGPRPSDADIARALNISLATLRRYVRDYGRPIAVEPPQSS